MIYGSVCSGIEAASVAWHPLGWTPSFFSEIEPFPRAVLAHHYPDVPLHGDFTTIKAGQYAAINVLVGGTPCQSFSIAGLRGGLSDERGNLALEFCRLAQRLGPQWVIWENVPGVLSLDGGRAFASILGGLSECGYGLAYRVLDAQFVRIHGFGRAVPQRRRRVYVVGYLGDWRRAAAVLFERHSLQRDTPPRRQAGQGTAPTLSARTKGGGGLGTDFDCDGGLVAFGGNNTSGPISAAAALNAKGGAGRMDFESETLVAHSLRGGGFDASEDGTGRGTPLVPVAQPYTLAIRGRGDTHNLEYRQDGTANAILTPNGGRAGIGVGAVCAPPTSFAIQAGALRENPDSGPDGVGVQEGHAYTLEARPEVQAVCFAENSRAELRLCGGDGSVSAQLTTGGGKPGQGQPCIAFSAKDHGADAMDNCSPTLRAGGFTTSHANAGVMPAVLTNWRVRRLTPRECEALQGFPDGYTQVMARAKPAADGPRYKALGNSMAVNVMRWIGARIDMVEQIAGAGRTS